MQTTRCLIIALLIFPSVFSVKAQNSKKAGVKKIEFAIYDYNSEFSEDRDKADISYYLVIDEKKNAKAQVGKKSPKLYSMTMNDSVIQQITAFFTGDNKLEYYKLRDELEPGTYYAASYRYISITYADNSKESLCYIPSMMSDKFNMFIDQLPDIDTKRNISNNAKELINNSLSKSVTDLHKSSKNLPEFKSPPPQ